MTCKEHRYALMFLAEASLAVYASSLGHEFVPDWDDSVCVVANPTAKGFSLEHLRVAFTTFFAGNYAPLQMISSMLDYTLWGLAPGGFILTNILLHTLSGLLFYSLLIRNGTGRGVACTAAYDRTPHKGAPGLTPPWRKRTLSGWKLADETVLPH